MKYINKCRCCGSDNLMCYIDLGKQPLANSYHKGEKLEKYPLEVNLCQNCFHSQLSVVIDPDIMFRNYLYVSGTTKTLKTHWDALAEDAMKRASGKRVLDIACNDAMGLECFRNLGCEVQGVDPSVNLRELSKQKNIPVEVDYWSIKVAKKLGKFDVILAANVFAHVDNIKEFLEACKIALKPDGFAAIEFPYCKNLIAHAEFDTVYHEHLSYFLVNSFRTIARACGFQIFDVIQTPIHGGSIRFFIRPNNGPDTPLVSELIIEEQNKGMLDVETYKNFTLKVNDTKEKFQKEIENQRKTRKVIGFGASAKGNTMLNYFNIKLDYIVDDNPMKWNHLTPGLDIPVCSPEVLIKEEGPLAIVILSWNFSKEIIKKITTVRPNNNDVCLLYVPETKIIDIPLSDISTLDISG